jgi:transcriptional regulator with XRE-family HTH domain
MTPVILRLRAVRERAGLTQSQLALNADVPQSRISEIERGVIKHLSLDVLDRLARALDVEPGSLIIRTAAKPRTR